MTELSFEQVAALPYKRGFCEPRPPSRRRDNGKRGAAPPRWPGGPPIPPCMPQLSCNKVGGLGEPTCYGEGAA